MVSLEKFVENTYLILMDELPNVFFVLNLILSNVTKVGKTVNCNHLSCYIPPYLAGPQVVLYYLSTKQIMKRKKLRLTLNKKYHLPFFLFKDSQTNLDFRFGERRSQILITSTLSAKLSLIKKNCGLYQISFASWNNAGGGDHWSITPTANIDCINLGNKANHAVR